MLYSYNIPCSALSLSPQNAVVDLLAEPHCQQLCCQSVMGLGITLVLSYETKPDEKSFQYSVV